LALNGLKIAPEEIELLDSSLVLYNDIFEKFSAIENSEASAKLTGENESFR